jgi:hypothetical protein
MWIEFNIFNYGVPCGTQTYVTRLISINKVPGEVKKGNIKAYKRNTYFPPEYIIPGL